MTSMNREIIKKANCNVIDHSIRTIDNHKKDLARRLKKQEKALAKGIEKGWSGNELVKTSIENIQITLEVLENWNE